REQLSIQDVRVGFVNTVEDFSKAGKWVPVIVLVDKIVLESFEGTLVVETTDTDGIGTRFTPSRVFMNRDERKKAFVTYIKTGSSSNKIRVSLEGKIGESTVRPRVFNYSDDIAKDTGRQATELMQQKQQKLVLALGKVKGLEPLAFEDQPIEAAGGSGQPTAGPGLSPYPGDKPWRVALQNDVNLLPEFSFGYDAVDVVVLATGGQWDN